MDGKNFTVTCERSDVGRGRRPPSKSPCLSRAAWHCVVAFDLACGLTGLASLAFGRLFVIAVSFHVACQPFALAHAFEAFQHLLDGFITSWSDLDQRRRTPFTNHSFAYRTPRKGENVRFYGK